MTKRTGIFGYPVNHSKSPLMHNAAYKELNLDYEYSKYEVTPDDLADKIKMIKENGLAGINITIPHKENVMKYLDVIDEAAQKIGAVNTVVNRNGKLYGYNTDGIGFIEGIKHYHKVDVEGKKIALFGDGGAARAIVISSYLKGAKEISIGGIELKKTSKLAKEIDDFAYNSRSSEFLKKISEADIVVNATPLGMHPFEDKSPLIDPSVIHDGQFVFDAVYIPKETKFLLDAKNRGATIGYGFEMLLFQGIVAFEKFTSSKAPIEVMEKALLS